MMNKQLSMLFLLVCLGSSAQNTAEKSQLFSSEFAPMNISYYGNFATHPGIKLGFDWNLLLIEKSKEKSRRTKIKRKLLFVAPSLAFYTHPKSHTGLLLSTDLGWRRYTTKLFYSEIGLGVGYLRKFNSGETWEIDADGNATSSRGTSRGYFAPSLSLGLGQHFSTKSNVNFDIFMKLNTNFILGYSAAWVPELSTEIGVRFSPNFGIKRGSFKHINK
jgi:hypothetical protein